MVSVRQLSQYVVWCPLLKEDEILGTPGLSDERFIVFDMIDYTKTLKSLPLPPTFLWANPRKFQQFSHNLKYPESANPETSLPKLSSAELYWLLWPFLPEDDLPLYRIPENTDDKRGVKLLRRVKAALEMRDDTLSAMEPPASWLEIRIGLDLPEFEECVWHIGKTSQGCAVRFHSNPHFPLWLSSSAINQAFEAECSILF